MGSMEKELLYIFLTSLVTVLAEKDNLPPCPTNIQFLPQNLPMHCRLPRSSDASADPSAPPVPIPLPPPFYQSPPSDMQPSPIPIPVPPGGPFPFPGIPPPGPPFPMPMPMMPMPGPAHKLPVIVMPFYSPDPAFKKTKGVQDKLQRRPKRPRRPRRLRRPRYRDTDTDTDTDTDSDCSDTDTSSDTFSDTSSDTSSDGGWWKRAQGKRGGKRNARRSNRNNVRESSKNRKRTKIDLLTPVLQYVTKDGYVIFEKEISKGEAKDWLQVKKEEDVEGASEEKNPNKGKVLNQKDNLDEMNPDYRAMSREREKVVIEVTTEKPHKHKKHHQHKPNLLLDTSQTDKRSNPR